MKKINWIGEIKKLLGERHDAQEHEESGGKDKKNEY